MVFAMWDIMALLQELAFKMDPKGFGGLFLTLANFVLLDSRANLQPNLVQLLCNAHLTFLLKWIFLPQTIRPMPLELAILDIRYLWGIFLLQPPFLELNVLRMVTENQLIGQPFGFNANQIASYNRVKILEIAYLVEPMGLNVFVKEFIQENIVK